MNTKILILLAVAATEIMADISSKPSVITNTIPPSIEDAQAIFGETNELMRTTAKVDWLLVELGETTKSLLTNIAAINGPMKSMETLKREIAEAKKLFRGNNLLNRAALLTYPTEYGYLQIAILGIAEKATNGAFSAVVSIHYPAAWELRETQQSRKNGSQTIEALFFVKTPQQDAREFHFSADLSAPHQTLTSPWRWSFNNQVSFLGYRNTDDLRFVPTAIRWVKDTDMDDGHEIKSLEEQYKFLERKARE